MEPLPNLLTRCVVPTIRDVAKQAGVGVGTVSRVLNGGGSVAVETRNKVVQAIELLNYRPSPAARTLSRGRAATIGVTAPFLTSPSVVQRLQGVVAGLDGSDYDLGLASVETPEQRERRFADLCQRHRVDGAILISLAPSADEARLLTSTGVPTVLVDARCKGLPSIVIDDVSGGRLATDHLIELGHRRIAFLSDDSDPAFRFTASGDRRRGYLQALAAAGIESEPHLIVACPHGREEAAAAAAAILAADRRPTAIFAASDTQALGVLQAARTLGIRVPDELSVIGFDDIELAGFVGLTTVRQPLFESGAAAARMLLQMLGGTPGPTRKTTHLHLDLVTRETTGRSRSRAPRHRSGQTTRSQRSDRTPTHDSEE